MKRHDITQQMVPRFPIILQYGYGILQFNLLILL